MLFDLKFILLLLLLASHLSSQGSDEVSKYSRIKDLIEKRDLSEAKKELDRSLNEENEYDPTLSLYRTEIWIWEGEKHYRSGNYKTAIQLFRKAHEFWPSHPLVNSRLAELNKKNLTNSGHVVKKLPDLVPKTTENLHQNKVFYIIDSAEDKELKNILQELKTELKIAREGNGIVSANEKKSNNYFYQTLTVFLSAIIVTLFAMLGILKRKIK